MTEVSQASPGWNFQTNLAEEPDREDATASVAMDAEGDTLIVWSKRVASYEAIEAAWRPAGGSFGSPIALSPVGDKAFAPAVAMDPKGDAVVVWTSHRPGDYPGEGAIEATSRSTGGGFTPPVEISPTEGDSTPTIAMNHEGNAFAAWTHYNDAYHLVEGTSFAAGGSFGPALLLSNPKGENPEGVISASGPTIAIDSAGDTTATWSANTLDGSYQPVGGPYSQFATKPAGGQFSEPSSLSQAGVKLVTSPSGETLMVWGAYIIDIYAIEAAVRPTIDEGFGPPLGLFSGKMSQAEASEVSQDVTIDAAGEVTAALQAYSTIVTTSRPLGGSFSQPVTVGEAVSSPSLAPVLATDDRGDSMVIWTNYGGNHAGVPVVESSMRYAGAQFGPSLKLATDGRPGPLHVATDSYGDAVGVWISSNGATDALHVAGYQATGPQLNSVQVPVEGQVGAELSFSASPRSVWSDVPSTTWLWGDGTQTTSGTSVRHRFAAPGRYTVSLTATDALGNATSASRTISINDVSSVAQEVHPPGATVRGPRPPIPEPVVGAFTPLFATQASTKKRPLGRIVGIAAVRGATNGDTIIVRCVVGCQRPLRETRHVSKHHNTHGAFAISPPFVVTRATRVQVELLAPGRVARFADYRFTRNARGVIPHPTDKGCLSPPTKPHPCP